MNTKKLGVALTAVIIFLVVFFPNIELAIFTASQIRATPSDAWVSSLSWMKENTPEPLGGSDVYYQLEPSREYPESAYGVLAWWDYGYWITRIAHRIPNANPGQSPGPVTSVAEFFTSQNETSANQIAEELGSAYIIIDYGTATGKFWAVVLWAGGEQADYFDVYYLPQGEHLIPVRLYYPDYYRSFSTRLYNFDGRAVTPESVTVISYEEKGDRKLIIGERQFDTYEAAEAYLLSQKSGNYKIFGEEVETYLLDRGLGNYKIVSDNPFISSVPLVAVENYRLVHSSDETIEYSDMGAVPEVKVFEYLPVSGELKRDG